MKRLISVLLGLLIAWGAFSLLIAAAFVLLLAYNYFTEGRRTEDTASSRDVRFFVGGNLAHAQVDKVVHSHWSERSFTGDHLDAYAVKMNNLTVDQLTASPTSTFEHWNRGDQPMPKILDEAISFVESGRSEVPWFPKESEVRSREYYISPLNLYYSGVKLISAGVIMVRPADGMVFYIELKT